MVGLCSSPWWNPLQEKPVGGEGSIPNTDPGQMQRPPGPTGQGRQRSEELSPAELNSWDESPAA